MHLLRADQLDFFEFSIRGKEYDVKFFGIHTIRPPASDAPYWEIDFEDGSKMITTDVISIRYGKKKK